MPSSTKKIVKIAGLSVFFILIIIYAFYRSHDLIFGIKIRDVNITDGSTLSESVIEISGNARNAIHLALNGREISVDQQGNFKETVALLPGYNIINIKAEDKFGYVDEKNYKLMHVP